MGTSDSSAGYSVETVATNADVFATPEIAYIIDDVGLHTGQVTDGGKTDDTQPELHGTGEPGSVVIVTMYGPITGKTYTLGHVTVGNDGTWHYQFTGKQGMQAGHGAENIFHVSSVDTDGHTVTSDAFTVTLTGSNADDNTPPDITPPDAPVITEVYDDVGTQQGPVANGGSTDDSQLKISGTAEHDSIVVISHVVESTGAIYVDGSVVADASGHWVFEMTGPFQPSFGNRIITATATDAAGNTSEPSDSFVVNFVDTNQDDITPPDQPTIDSFHDDAGNSLSGATTDDATPTLQGHAEANSIVNVYEGGTLLGSTIAGADGTWSYTTPERADGMHDFTVTATDAAGNTSAHSADFVVNVVSEIITMVTPTIDSYHDDAGASFGSGTYTDDRDPTLHGHAQAGSIVRVYIDNGREGTAIADADGNWQYTPKYNLLHTHVFTVDSVLQGNLSDTSEKFVINIEPQPESSYHWDFNDETFQGWSVLGEHATSEDGFTNSITTNQRAEFRTDKRFGKDYNGDVMSTKIYVEAGKTYDFSYQYGHITDYKMLTAANVGLTVDGQLVGGYHTATDAAQTITGSWTAKTSGEITLAFNDKVSTGSGNDFWIDNISAVQQGVSAQAETQALTLSRVQTEDTHTDASANNANLIELSTAIQSPAHADITDHVQNTLHLTLSDILSEAHPNLFVQDGKQQLAVTGDQGDVVELKVEDITHAEWQDSGAVTAGGIQYEVYQHAGSDVELLVQHGLELHQVS
ncbi:hypothetical protein D6C13_23225 [Rahnella woolbedingensis]|uniref:Bacterial Ig-like domain-containing protein n=2 Tax=Rahnella woolbedingensis TaxID=1510574 RepID=A0A419N314_9GAMM|nr:hypothetical protein D6C13_23225 [Rahnella woolbedingensis]